jgi:predicted DNA-binding transcriptional regulator AlpA
VTSRYLTERDLTERGLFSRAHRERLVKKKLFPAPLQPGGPGGKRFWPEETIDNYEKALAAEREAKSPEAA